MKKSTKFFVFGGLIGILAGGIIMLVTGCIGGISMIHTIVTEYSYPEWNFGNGCWSWDSHGIEYHDSDDRHHDSIVERETILLDESANEINSLCIYDVDGVDLKIIQSGSGDGKMLSVNGLGIEYTVDGGRLLICSRTDNGWFHSEGEIILSVPADTYWETMEIEFGAGELEMEDVYAGSIRLDVGAGEASLDRIKADTIEIHVGAGEVDAEKMEIYGDVNVSVGLGEVDYSGDTGGSLDFSCGTGNIKYVERNGLYEDYNYDIKCAAGNVRIDGYRFSGLSFDKRIDNYSRKIANIDCGIGNISVYFGVSGFDD